MEGRNGNTVLLTVIGVATLLVALVGATFAYFTASVSNGASQSISIVTAAPVQLETATTGTVISLANAIPGATASNNGFTVLNPSNSSVDQSYDMYLVVDEDTFVTTCADGTAKDTVLGLTAGQSYTCSTEGAQALFDDQLELTITTETNATNGTAPDLSAAVSAMSGKTATKAVYNLTAGSTVKGVGKYQLVNDQKIIIGETQTFNLDLNFKEINLNQTDNANGKTFIGHLAIDDAKALSTATTATGTTQP